MIGDFKYNKAVSKERFINVRVEIFKRTKLKLSYLSTFFYSIFNNSKDKKRFNMADERLQKELDVSRLLLKMRKLKLIENVVLQKYQKVLVKVLRISLIDPDGPEKTKKVGIKLWRSKLNEFGALK